VKAISINNDIIPIAEFKSGISKWFKSLKDTGHPLVITQNGKPAGVLLTPKDYDDLIYRKSFLDSVKRGIADADNGRTSSTKELKMKLASRRSEA
jgi:antitoxin YefM